MKTYKPYDGIKYDVVIVDYPTLIFEPKVSEEVTRMGRSLIRQLTRTMKLDQLLNEEENDGQ
jgi:hypothetical protein